MNYFESQILEEIEPLISSGKLSFLSSCENVFSIIAAKFPISSSRIDWSLVPGSIERFLERGELEVVEFANFFKLVTEKEGLNGPVTYAGDGATDFSVIGSVAVISEIIPSLVSIPQHHFFLGSGGDWCINFTFEGDMAFGYSPRRTC